MSGSYRSGVQGMSKRQRGQVRSMMIPIHLLNTSVFMSDTAPETVMTTSLTIFLYMPRSQTFIWSRWWLSARQNWICTYLMYLINDPSPRPVFIAAGEPAYLCQHVR